MNNSTQKPTPWKTLSSKTGYDHPFFKVREDEVQLPNGSIIPDYTVWENENCAQTVVFHNGKTILVELYKHGVGEIITEFPGGFINTGESPKDAAKRELREETGIVAHTLIPLTTCSHHTTKEKSKTHLFLAIDVEIVKDNQDLDVTEDIVLHWVPFTDVFKMIEKGEIIQTGSIAGAFLAREKLLSEGLLNE